MFNASQIVAGLACGTILMAAAAGADAPKSVQRAFKVEKTITKTVQCRYLLYLPENYEKYRDLFQFILDVPADWEESLAEANQHIPVERRKCLRAVERFKKLRVRVLEVLRGSPEAAS